MKFVGSLTYRRVARPLGQRVSEASGPSLAGARSRARKLHRAHGDPQPVESARRRRLDPPGRSSPPQSARVAAQGAETVVSLLELERRHTLEAIARGWRARARRLRWSAAPVPRDGELVPGTSRAAQETVDPVARCRNESRNASLPRPSRRQTKRSHGPARDQSCRTR